jgi:hypothetical protein
LAQALHYPMKIEYMKRTIVLSALIFLLAGGLSAQLVQTQKVKVHSKPISSTAINRNSVYIDANTMQVKLVKTRMAFKTMKATSVKRKKSKK